MLSIESKTKRWVTNKDVERPVNNDFEENLIKSKRGISIKNVKEWHKLFFFML